MYVLQKLQCITHQIYKNISHYKTKTCATKSRGGRKFDGDTGEDGHPEIVT